MNNYHQKTFDFSDTIFFDTITVLPSSIIIYANNEQVADTLWDFDILNSAIIFNKKINSQITIHFRSLQYSFKDRYLLDSSLIVPKIYNFSFKTSNIQTNTNQTINSSSLQTTGFISRSVGVGNNQDPVITSKMNLNISGKLNDDLFIEAVAFDETMPIQPDGNTAQIQELNNIHIKVFNDNFQLNAGDFYIEKPKSYFLKYNKQVKGIQYFTQNKNLFQNVLVNSFSFGAAIAKGKYKKQPISGVEGNQGPYRLTGNNGETYIVVLAESERIYLNGNLLQRGENMDYTINYNTAEINFTAQNIITKDSRIIVEFEYSERNYSRFAIFSNNTFSVNNNNFYFNFLSETDAKNQTIDRELTDNMKKIMYFAGDSLNLAILPNVDTVVFSEDKILYKKIDTIISNEIIEYYEYSTNSTLAIYQVNFAYVGQNNGNYIISEQLTNGRVYKFVEPINGQKQGDYAPNATLITPKKLQIYDFGANFKLSKTNIIDVAFSISQNDKNLFSPLNDDDNFGVALNINYRHFINGNDTSAYKTYYFAKYEYAGENFSPIETYKNQEFNRDWNISKNFISDEHFLQTGFYSLKSTSIFTTSISSLFHSNEYFSIKPDINGKIIRDNNAFTYSLNHLQSSNYINSTKFTRSNLEYKQKIGLLSLGAIYEQETNIWKKFNADTLLKNSFMFHSAGIYAQTTDTNIFVLKSEIRRRWDFLPELIKLTNVSYSNNFNLFGGFDKQNYNGNIVLNYRQLYVQDTNLLKIEPENSLNSKANINFSLFNNTFGSTSSIELKSGLEQKIQFIYIEVEPTKGIYTWIDYNDDGKKQIDEFEIAQFADQATYLRVQMQSNEYQKIYAKNINQTINFLPANLFSDTKSIYKLASKFNNSSSINLEHKSYNFNLLNISDSNTVNYSLILSNMLTINILSGTNIKLSYQKYSTKVELITGIDNLFREMKKISIDIKLLKYFTLFDELGTEINNSNSDYSLQKKYLLLTKENNIMLRFFKDDFIFEIKHFYADKQNKQGNETLIMNKLEANINYIITSKQSVDATFSYINNNFSGDATSSVSYEMLQGLKPNKNYTWQLNLSHKIGSILNVSILYSGRYSEGNKIIHSGAVSIAAFL
ncbi:MAG: hypothetical protein JXR68_01610 [Bacteroidales bacterium]|nr:hypothetical protein [Bacteroidales bacterium]